MFSAVLSRGPACLGLIFLVFFVLLYGGRRVVKDYQIRTSKAGGIRAPILGTNPVTGNIPIPRPPPARLTGPQASGSSWMRRGSR